MTPRNGDPVVFVHGAGGDHTVWRFQTRWLARRGYRVLATDLPAHGPEPGPALETVEEMGRWLADRLPGPSVVVGHSLGSLVAIETSVRHPNLVSGLVLVSSSPRMWVHSALSEAAGRDVARAAAFIAGWTMPPAFTGGHPEPGTWESGAVERLVRRSKPGILAVDLAACERYDAAVMARAIPVETLVVSGTRDRMTPSRRLGELVEAIGSVRVELIEGAGHDPMIQMPRRFNLLLFDYLMRRGNPGGQ